MTNDRDLLEQYNPSLVILPRDTSLHRPWSRWYQVFRGQRGDYHPCSAEFFLSYVLQRNRPRPWMEDVVKQGEEPEALGLDALRALVEGTPRPETDAWEIDLVPIPSQRPEPAWSAYASMLQKSPELSRPVVYARCVRYADRTCLQYWYLYPYNDAPNKHEGDWEMVTIELDASEAPTRAAFAGHASGYRRPWSRVKKSNGRPLVYVARGSHAAYFDHRRGGHRGNSLRSRKGWPEPLDTAWAAFARLFQDTLVFLRLNDKTVPAPDDPQEANNRAEVVNPELLLFPPPEGEGAGDFWWMKLECRWGSRHSRIFGTIAPAPAWRAGRKWEDPSAWIDSLDED